ncbi:hypothetical protein [Cylindrospermopsis raciborskii]|uniref:hypothetical protein n=1 Tax=Cylindrospermopsis raciborskii TaxID=77022 RepID=UPI003DA68416
MSLDRRSLRINKMPWRSPFYPVQHTVPVPPGIGVLAAALAGQAAVVANMSAMAGQN